MSNAFSSLNNFYCRLDHDLLQAIFSLAHSSLVSHCFLNFLKPVWKNCLFHLKTGEMSFRNCLKQDEERFLVLCLKQDGY